MPTPTKEQLDARLATSGQTPASVDTTSTPTYPAQSANNVVITATGLQTPQAPIKVPTTPTVSDYQSQAQASLDTLLAGYTAPTSQETEGSDLQKRILESLGTLGTEKTRQQQLRTEAGIPEQNKELQGVINQLQGLQKEAVAIPLQLQQDVQGRGVTAAGLAPIQTGKLRENAIKSLTLAAIGQTLQGNISLAESTIKNALDAEFEPERQKLATLQQLYTFNKDALERADKKKADALNIAIGERTRILNDQKTDKTFASDIMLEAARAGAPQNVLETIRNSTPDKAIELATTYLGADFKQKAEQQAFDNGIKLRTVAASEYANKLSQKKNLIELATLGDKEAIKMLGYDPNNLPLTPKQVQNFEEQKLSMDRDIEVVNRASNNNIGLQSSAGLIRGGITGAFLESPFGILGAPYAASKKQDFLSDASYVVKNLTFDKIKELADKGIKLTPISNTDLNAMASASNVLAAAARYDDNGNLTGFNMSENKVKEQLKLVADKYQSAKDNITADLLLTNEDKKEILGI